MFESLGDGLFGFENETGKYLLQQGDFGVRGEGKCWRLWVTKNNITDFIAAFVTIDDEYESCSRLNYENCISWSLDDILKHADKVVEQYSVN